MSNEERTPPARIRVTKLQEAQIPELMRIEQACAEQYYALGFDAAEVPLRSEQEFYKLPRDHAVRVVEADNEPAGYVAFRDEAPGIVYVEDIEVHPEMQRFALGSALIERVCNETRELGLPVIIVKVFERAEFATAFYSHHGFSPIDDNAHAAARDWLRTKQESADVFPRPDQLVLVRAV